MDILFSFVVFGFIGAVWMKKKGRSPQVGLALGGFLNIFGLIIIYFLTKDRPRASINRQVSSNNPKPTYSGTKFAQDSGKGSLFHYASNSNGRELLSDFAIIDLETSGLEPSRARVIEVAILLMNSKGEIHEEYATLVNPQDGFVGPTFIHHITEESVISAPTFQEIAGEILKRFENRIVVAHHAAFEDKFLASEFKRAGIEVPPIPALDTLWLSRQVLDLPNYKMQTVLEVLGIEEIDLHTALGDVRALAKALPILLEKSPTILYPTVHTDLPKLPDSDKQKTRVTNLKKGEKGWISGLLEKLPESGMPINSEIEKDYLDLLEKVLADGKIIGEEAKALSKLAGEAGLGKKQLITLHEAFLKSIKIQAEADGNVDAAEMKKIEQVLSALNL